MRSKRQRRTSNSGPAIEALESRQLLSADASVAYLSDLPADAHNVHGGLQRDTVYWQDDMVVDGQIVSKGLGMHAPRRGVGRARFDVPAGARTFEATLALAEARGTESATHGSVRFRAYVDGELRYESPVVRFATEPIDVSLDVGGAKSLTVEVDALGNHNSDQAVLAEARFRLDRIYLSDLPATEKNIHAGLQRDTVYWQDDMVLDGRFVRKGLGMHAPNRGVGVAEFQVPDGAHSFRATLGLAEARGHESARHGAVKYRVYVDGDLRYESGVVKFATAPIEVSEWVDDAQTLRLEVDSLGTNHSDQAVFADARFELAATPDRQFVHATTHRGATMYLSAAVKGISDSMPESAHDRASMQAHLQHLSQGMGANLIRVQLLRYKDGLPVVENRSLKQFRKWRDATLDRLEEVVQIAGEVGLRVVVDLHTAPGGAAGGANADLNVNPNVINTLFSRQDPKFTKSRNEFVRTWTKIATRFRDAPAIVGYDLLNEPHYKNRSAGLWRQLVKETVTEIRRVDPDAVAIVEGQYGKPQELTRFKPLNRHRFPNVVYSLHTYGHREPQAAASEWWDPIVAYQQKHDVPIYVGEFDGSYGFLRNVIDIFEANGWNWTFHNYNGKGMPSEPFLIEEFARNNPTDSTSLAHARVFSALDDDLLFPGSQ